MIWDGLKAHRSRLVRDHLDSLGGHIQIAFLPPYASDLNPVEYLWAWLKRHALANYLAFYFCPVSVPISSGRAQFLPCTPSRSA